MAGSRDSGTVFISYSHEDAAYLARLQQHLTPYVRSGAIPLWDDTQLKPGDDWKRGIEQALGKAHVALLLVSVGFLASEFVAKEELPRLLAAAEARGTRILPVILTPCNFRRTTLSRFQAVNEPSQPLSGLSQYEQDLVWERVVETVLNALEAPAPAPPKPTPSPVSEPPKPQPAPSAVPSVSPPPKQQPAPVAAPAFNEQAKPQPAPPTWRLKPGTLLLTYLGHTSAAKDGPWARYGVQGYWPTVHSVAWAPVYGRVASAGNDGTVRVWEATGGRELLICQEHKGGVRSVAWAPDGARLASAGIDGDSSLVGGGQRAATPRLPEAHV